MKDIFSILKTNQMMEILYDLPPFIVPLLKLVIRYDIKSWREWRTQHITRKGTEISKAAVNREFAFLKAMLNHAIEWEWLAENPTEKIKPPRGEKKRLRFLNNEEISKLIFCSNAYLKPIIITAISTGMRFSEIMTLKWNDVNLVHGFIRIVKSKNNETRNVPINGFLAETLLSLTKSRKIGNYVFCKDDGERRKSIKGSFNSACEKAGLSDFRFHDLRHTTASLFPSRGCDVITLQNLLGHKTLAMTQRYAHLIPDKHEKTRKIMQEFWSELGDTLCDTVGVFGKEVYTETPNIP